jgi:hypothetical protein
MVLNTFGLPWAWVAGLRASVFLRQLERRTAS